MMDQPGEPHRRCNRTPAGEAGGQDDIWLSAWHAAMLVERSERWLREQCRAGRLACRGEPRTGETFLVPMAAAEGLATQATPPAPASVFD
jgi:hypothetical protein